MNFEVKKGDKIAIITAMIYHVMDFQILDKPNMHKVKVCTEDENGNPFVVVSVNKKVKHTSPSTLSEFKLIDKTSIGNIVPCSLITYRRKIVTLNTPEHIEHAVKEMDNCVKLSKNVAINELKETLEHLVQCSLRWSCK